jgi:ubiquinone/menaquinone biosynthesis C-methylase UbiE
MQTTNFEKHTTTNPISKFFLNHFLKVLLQEIEKLQPQSILDVGAGEGFTLQNLKDNNIGEKLEGIEYVDEAIAISKKLHPALSIKKGDIYNLPYHDNAFDVVVCTEVLEHLDDPGKALDEIKRVTKKYLILSVPNEPYFTIQRFFRGKNVLHLGDHPEHIQHWSKNSFQNFIVEKLRIKIIKTPFPWILIVAET